MRPVEGFVAFRGHETWYRVTGDLSSGRTPLLLLHGGPGGASDYFEPLEALSDTGRAVVRYDQLGGGRSDRPRDPALWTVETFVEELGALRRELRLHKVHLLGQSWGGTLAVEYMLTEPVGVTSLVLQSTPVDWPLMRRELERLRAALPDDVVRAMRRIEPSLRPRKESKAKRRLADKDIERTARVARAVTRVLLTPAARRLAVQASSVPLLRAFAYQVLGLEFTRRYNVRLPPAEWPLCLFRSLVGLNRQAYETMWGPSEFFGTGSLKDLDRTARLGDLDVPTLVMNGRHDSITPAQGELLRDGIPGAELVIFEDSSHTAHIEETTRYIAVLSKFLDRVEPAP